MYTPENMCLVIAKLKLWNMFFPAVTNRPLTIFFETLDIYLQRVSSLDAIFCSCGKTFFFKLRLKSNNFTSFCTCAAFVYEHCEIVFY